MRILLEKRLINLALSVDGLCKRLEKNYFSAHLTTQIIRSSTAAALNYGEAQAAESKKDFIHKVSVVQKELRETKVCLELLSDSIKEGSKPQLFQCKDECDQLIAIFHKTIMSAIKNG
mgnify:CR=1 FL=1